VTTVAGQAVQRLC